MQLIYSMFVQLVEKLLMRNLCFSAIRHNFINILFFLSTQASTVYTQLYTELQEQYVFDVYNLFKLIKWICMCVDMFFVIEFDNVTRVERA